MQKISGLIERRKEESSEVVLGNLHPWDDVTLTRHNLQAFIKHGIRIVISFVLLELGRDVKTCSRHNEMKRAGEVSEFSL